MREEQFAALLSFSHGDEKFVQPFGQKQSFNSHASKNAERCMSDEPRKNWRHHAILEVRTNLSRDQQLTYKYKSNLEALSLRDQECSMEPRFRARREARARKRNQHSPSSPSLRVGLGGHRPLTKTR